MSLLGRMFSAATVSKSDFQNPRPWLLNSFGGHRTPAGELVTPTTAMNLSGFYHAIRSISEDLGKIALITYKGLKPKGKMEDKTHPAYRLLRTQPHENVSAHSFKETITQHALGFGNGFAHIERNPRTNFIDRMWPIHPTRVHMQMADKNGPRGYREIIYEIHNDDGRIIKLTSEQIFHLHGMGSNGIQGYSVYQLAAKSLGLGLAVETFGSTFFGNGTQLSGAISHPGKLSRPAIEGMKETWNEHYRGPANSHKVLFLEEGSDWKTLGVEPEQAQFLSTREFTVEEMARWFRMPVQKMGILIKAGSGGQKLKEEDVQSIYVTDTLLPWFNRWEEECLRKVFVFEDDLEHFAMFQVSGLLRGSSESRADFASKMFHVGGLSQNEMREVEGWNPIGPQGDVRYVPTNMIPDTMAAEGLGAGNQSQPERDQTQTDKEREDQQRRDDQGAPDSLDQRKIILQGIRPLFVDAFARLIRKEESAMARAVKRYESSRSGFPEWVDSFADDQRELAMDLLEAPHAALVNLTQWDDSYHNFETVTRALRDFKTLSKELHRDDPSSVVSRFKAMNEAGRDEQLATALCSEYESHWSE